MIKTKKEIKKIRAACKLAADTLNKVEGLIKPGLTTNEINKFVHADTLAKGATPAPLNYNGFPKSVCTSVNDVVCHGVPGTYILKDGDIINVDVTHRYKKYHGDTSRTFYVGTPSEEAKLVVETARKCLEIGIAEVKPGFSISVIGAAIEEYAKSQGCSVVRDFVGHGIGREFHEQPFILHYKEIIPNPLMIQPGMVFTIEPMVNLGTYECEVMSDRHTTVTKDGKLSAQFEHTILVTETGCEVLTK